MEENGREIQEAGKLLFATSSLPAATQRKALQIADRLHDMLNSETARARYILLQSLHVLFCFVLGDVGLISRMSRPLFLEVALNVVSGKIWCVKTDVVLCVVDLKLFQKPIIL
jgi:hypothetical protein